MNEITKETVDRAAQGDRYAIEELYTLTYNDVYRSAKFLLQDEDTVLDIVQDSYVAAFQNLDRLTDRENFRPWVRRIAANKAKDYIKRKKPILFSEMAPEVLRQISERAYQECQWGNSVDIYDGISNKTPWGAEISDIRVGDTALLAVNRQTDMEYSFLLVPVYKTLSTDEWYDVDAGARVSMTWADVVGYYKFSDITVHPDGSVSFNENYVELHGNYTDSQVADKLYLNDLRGRYTFTDVTMP